MRKSLSKLLDYSFERILFAHGTPILSSAHRTAGEAPERASLTCPETRRRENVVTRFLRLIRFSHTIFALPFALGALLVAADGRPSMRTCLLVLVCMVFARTAAMLFNRLSDWSLDQRNPRTATRHLLLTKPIACGAPGNQRGGLSPRERRDQSRDRLARAGRAGYHFLLFPDQTLHERHPFFPRVWRWRSRRRGPGSRKPDGSTFRR